MNGALTFQDILLAKEERAKRQQELLRLYHSSVVSISANMPGGIKYNEDTVHLIYDAISQFREQMRDFQLIIREERICHSLTGPTAFMAIEGDAGLLKGIAINIEENLKYGRLLDIDVFDREGRQINRSVQGIKQRSCFVCSQPAVVCIRSEAHPREEVGVSATALLSFYRSEKTKRWPDSVDQIGKTAVEAILMEVACTPSPGLVDRLNSGAHHDMDFFSFISSSVAISTAMYRCALAGYQHRGKPDELLPILRLIGLEAEKEMYLATGGVNTHKGMLFVMGILAASASLATQKSVEESRVQAISSAAAGICRGMVDRELVVLRDKLPDRALTAGERYFLHYGIKGIRGEMEAGMPSVLEKGLPALREALQQGCSINDALVHALLGLMTQTEDTAILNRHGINTLTRVQAEAQEILDNGGMLTEQGRRQVKELDDKYTAENINPGGSADLLAATYFMYVMESK